VVNKRHLLTTDLCRAEQIRACVGENSVYIIFRVFSLATYEIDVRLYVNPLNLQAQGVLHFEQCSVSKFRVTPVGQPSH
jgi:hypothetical protein